MSGNHDFITKYRPTKFIEVIGQGSMVRSLQTAIEKETARAFLLSGPSGCGKTTLARITAREFGCAAENVMEIDAATHTGIDAMRSVMERISYTPLTATSKRAVIIDECASLSSSAWQSLLKNVEEPVDAVYWFFCTTNLEKVPKTIMTRCATYHLSYVKIDDLLDLLEDVCEKEGVGVASEILRVIAGAAEGSPRQALSFLSMCIDCDTAEEASDLVQSADTVDKEVIDLCRVLLKGSLTLQQLQLYAKALEGRHAESIRMVVVSYLGSVLKSCKSDSQAIHILQLLDMFSSSWHEDRTGQTSLLLTLGQCVYQTKE